MKSEEIKQDDNGREQIAKAEKLLDEKKDFEAKGMLENFIESVDKSKKTDGIITREYNRARELIKYINDHHKEDDSTRLSSSISNNNRSENDNTSTDKSTQSSSENKTKSISMPISELNYTTYKNDRFGFKVHYPIVF